MLVIQSNLCIIWSVLMDITYSITLISQYKIGLWITKDKPYMVFTLVSICEKNDHVIHKFDWNISYTALDLDKCTCFMCSLSHNVFMYFYHILNSTFTFSGWDISGQLILIETNVLHFCVKFLLETRGGGHLSNIPCLIICSFHGEIDEQSLSTPHSRVTWALIQYKNVILSV